MMVLRGLENNVILGLMTSLHPSGINQRYVVNVTIARLFSILLTRVSLLTRLLLAPQALLMDVRQIKSGK